MPLTLSGLVASEPRRGGVRKIRVTFDGPVTSTDGTLDAGNVALSSGTVDAVTAAGNVLTVDLSGAQANACLSITFKNIACADNPQQVIPDNILKIIILEGDINGDGTVNLLDVAVLGAEIGGTVSPASGPSRFRSDVDADGAVNVLDQARLADNFGTTVGCQ